MFCKIKSIVFIILICSSSAIVWSQSNRGNIWYFGGRNDPALGINFNNKPATILPAGQGQNNSLEGAAALSNTNGQLMFYSDGIKVFDKSHTMMPNGGSLQGHSSSTQSALIAPVIESNTKYYLFTTAGPNAANPNLFGFGWPTGLSYSVVDMTLSGNGTIACPLGDIVDSVKNINLLDSTSEKLTAVTHTNGTDYWIITTRFPFHKYYAFLVTKDGVNSTPVISSGGHLGSYNGALKSSNDENNLLSANYYAYDSNTSSYTAAGPFGNAYLLSFDRSTGRINSSQTQLVTPMARSYYGAEFSPNDSILYVSENQREVYQYQRFSANIPSTEKTLSNTSRATALELAPDGKIYFARSNRDRIGAINNPNNLSNPDATDSAFFWGGSRSGHGLPNTFKAFQLGSFAQPHYAANDTFVCNFDDSVFIGATAQPMHEYTWAPAYGLSDSSIANPKAYPDSTVTYTVEVIFACDTFFDTITITVYPAPDSSDLVPDTMCLLAQSSIVLDSGWHQYLWSNGDTSRIFMPDTTGLYEIEVSNIWGCSRNDSTHIFINGLNITDTILCSGQKLSIMATDDWTEYLWETTSEHEIIGAQQNLELNIEEDVELLLKAKNYCNLWDSITVEILAEGCNVFIPNAFSPNSKNNLFRPQGINPDAFTLKVYNRLGEEVFYTSDANYFWDGSHKGKMLNNDVYTYYLENRDAEGKTSIYRGNVSIIK